MNEQRAALATAARIGEVECSAIGSLRQAVCYEALKRLMGLLQRSRIHLPKLDLLVVMGSSEMSVVADHYVDAGSNKSILLIRSDFSLSQLARFFYKQGWTSKYPGGFP
jgi:hypothetical protein